jgi:hypothetical protein
MTTRRALAVQALFVVGLLSAGLHAQSVGIGTATPHPSARLHIEDNARGLLIPNVALTGTNDVTTVSGPATSLLVYNTNTAGTGATAVTPGFYYWDGSQWVRLLGGGDAWLLTGNYSTNPAVNFLGTRDNNSLCIRVNNQQTFQFNTNFSIQRDASGNARGQDAVDLQRVRSIATQVASGQYSVIGGGRNNTASGSYATVSGGLENTASGQYATVGGGLENTASGQHATTGGGWQNNANGQYATVGGGRENNASGQYATVGGGRQNTASLDYATVGGGRENTASVDYATVGGGRNNTARGNYATVGGGRNNTADVDYATVGGGESNIASGLYATVGGGQNNTANVDYATVGGGWQNNASGLYATVGGGQENNASGLYATVGGGQNNTANVDYATVGGGWQNTASSDYATVGGGQQNTASSDYATVGGGYGSTASGSGATVGGGLKNTASGFAATVGGGYGSTASGFAATVGGGHGNTASGGAATVGGGEGNAASGDYSAIPGGFYLQVGPRSFGFSGQTTATQTDLSANSNIAAFVDVNMWLYSRDFANASQLRFYEAQAHGSGANYVALRAPNTLSANTTYTLPASAPATSAAWLQSDNTGAMSWRPVFYGTVSVDPPNIGGNMSATFTVTITGVQPGDLVFLTPPSGIEGGLVFQGADVTAANTVTIRMRNVTGVAVDGIARTWSYMVIRP